MEHMDRLLDPKAAAKVLNVSISWLAKARAGGYGPEFVTFGRNVRYSGSSLQKFIKDRTRTSTRKKIVRHNTSQYISITEGNSD
jgi:hypothetical protein